MEMTPKLRLKMRKIIHCFNVSGKCGIARYFRVLQVLHGVAGISGAQQISTQQFAFLFAFLELKIFLIIIFTFRFK